MAPSSCIELTNSEQTELLGLARWSIEHGAATGEPLAPDTAQLSGQLAETLASFVTLTQQGELRGCVGSIDALHALGQSVALAAFSAAFRDHRFAPLPTSELAMTQIEIAVLSQPAPIEAGSHDELLAALRPGEDGVIVECNGQRATFLPKVWQQLPDADDFVRRLVHKAELPDDYWSESVRFHRYRTLSFSDTG